MRLETDLGTADVGMVEFEFNIFLCSLSPLLLPPCPVACVLWVSKEKGSVVLQGNSSTAEAAPLSPSCEISPYQSPASVSLSS